MKTKQYARAMLCAAVILISANTAIIQAAPAVTNQTPATVSVVGTTKQVTSTNWASAVKTDINDFFKLYGNQSPAYHAQQRPYAVFDFDNTTSIMDVEEQLMIWQLDHLAFAIPPARMQAILETGIAKDKLSLTYGANDGDGKPVRIADAIQDTVATYTSLYNKGAVTVLGKEQTAAIKDSADYREFTTKMRWLYDAIGETMDASVSYPWVTYWFTGMSPKQVYRLAYNCDSYYGDPAKGQTWTKGTYQSPSVASHAGIVSVSYKKGITVTPEIKELYAAMKKNGIDNWINSASQLDVIRAAVDYFAIPGVKGVVAMTNKLDSHGDYTNVYDYDLHAQTQGVGKADTVSKVLLPKYNGHGPSFCAMDSQGDFNFVTEFKDTKEVLIINRKRKDDAALCAGIAVWQNGHHISLEKANRDGDTKFTLQGRNENTGTFWADDHTLLLGKKEKAFLSPKAEKAITQLNQGMPIKEVLQKDTKLKQYQGYKTR